ncbi:MAG: hypothetical protein J4N89_15490 [Chloroflexi bacterium]|nr:hypothetical protein [Chloroflexota bacterium]
MVVGSTVGSPEEVVRVQISLDSAGATVASIQVNLAFDGGVLTSPAGAISTALPEGWVFESNSPAAGELRFVLLDLTAVGQPFNGPIFEATFTIDAGAPAGDVSITAAVAEAVDDAGMTLIMTVTDGIVTVTAALVVGSTVGSPEEVVTVQISLDSAGTTVSLVQVNLRFNGVNLTSPVGARGTALPAAWFFISNSPATGELRFVSLDLAGMGQPINGPIFEATFTIDAGAPLGDVSITAEVATAIDDAGVALIVTVTNGVVTVAGP